MPPAEDFLQSFLADRDAPCPGCAYNLRGLTTDRCPECNQHLVLRVNLAEPRLGSWLSGMVGAACGAGFNGLLLFYVGIMMVRESGRGLRGVLGPFLVVNCTGLVIMALVLLAWIRGRAKFRRAPTPIKAMLIMGTWLLAAADVTVFAFTIR